MVVMKILSLLVPALLLSACAHKADLKTPAQIEAAEKKAEVKAAKEKPAAPSEQQ